MLKRLKYFQSVVRLNSFSEAAEENYISQSAISQQIQALERELGFKLLERRNRTFALTPAGEYFCQKSLVLTADFERMCGEAAFLRNDGDPGLATLGVLSGGIFNVFGDYFFVFTCDMGIYGAGLATAIGSGISFAVMLTHFARRRNTLRLVRTEGLFTKLREISVTGFSTFFIDVATGILTVLFNRQIMKYLGANALAIYGPIIQVSTFVQCCAYSVGLFSGDNEAAGGVHRVGVARPCYKRHSHHAPPGRHRRGFAVVCHAGDGACCHALHRVRHGQVYKGAA